MRIAAFDIILEQVSRSSRNVNHDDRILPPMQGASLISLIVRNRWMSDLGLFVCLGSWIGCNVPRIEPEALSRLCVSRCEAL
jgi:hypothetical protein